MSAPLCPCGCNGIPNPRRKYATFECFLKLTRRKPKVCPTCGETFQPKKPTQECCTPSCAAVMRWSRYQGREIKILAAARQASYAAYVKRVSREIEGLLGDKVVFSRADVARILLAARTGWINHGYKSRWQRERRGRAA
jgi:hypothetical protein